MTEHAHTRNTDTNTADPDIKPAKWLPIEKDSVFTILFSTVQHSDSVFLQITLPLKLMQNNGCISPMLYNISLLLIYFIHSDLCLLIPYSYLALPLSLFPSGIQEFILDTCESVSVCLISWIPHINDKYSICISLSNLSH